MVKAKRGEKKKTKKGKKNSCQTICVSGSRTRGDHNSSYERNIASCSDFTVNLYPRPVGALLHVDDTGTQRGERDKFEKDSVGRDRIFTIGG